MANDPRAALDRLLAAFEAHFDAAASAREEDAPAVESAAATLADAFENYDDALFTRFGVDTPFDVYDDADDDADDDEDDDEDEDYEDLDDDDDEDDADGDEDDRP